MHITTRDLDFLIYLENKLGLVENWSKDVHRLWKLNQRLIDQYTKENKKSCSKKRKTNKNYARGKHC